MGIILEMYLLMVNAPLKPLVAKVSVRLLFVKVLASDSLIIPTEAR
jgi:hypothetical protein